MTNHFADMKNADVIVACGGNNAENHPASMRWVNKARSENGAEYIVVDPRYNRSAATADVYVPIRSGTDIAFFGGLINYIIENERYMEDYVKLYTNATWLINEDFSFDDGMFSGWDEEKNTYNKDSWSYQTDGFTEWDTEGAMSWVNDPGVPEFETPRVPNIKKDESLRDPQCVFQLMKKHYSRYTPEVVSAVCGMSVDQFNMLAEKISATGAPDKVATFLYAMGLTQHTKGAQNIRALAMVQLLLGNMGRAGGGVNALRGECNVQGSTDWGLLYGNLPGYLGYPTSSQDSLGKFLSTQATYAGFKTNAPKWVVSLLKEWYGDAATVDNDYCYDYIPKLDAGQNFSFLRLTEDLVNGKVRMMFNHGTNPAASGANASILRDGLANLEMLVCEDLWETETAGFWHRPGVDPASIQTEVFMLPMAAHYEKEGTTVNSGRLITWRYQAVQPLGDCIDDGQFYWMLGNKLKEIYESNPGVFPDPILDMYWDYGTDGHFDPCKSAWGANGYIWNKNGERGELLDSFAKLKADGTTACSMWVYTGYFANNDAPLDPTQQRTGMRDGEDVTIDGLEGGMGTYPNWGWSWPLNRHVIYNRASCDAEGQPYDPTKPLVWFKDGKWLRNDVPDFGFTAADGTHLQPENTVAFMMNTENVARFFAPGLAEGPFPEHYEPIESPVNNLLSSTETNPKALLFPEIMNVGDRDQYPIVATNYRLSEHWQTGGMTRNVGWTAEAQPDMFVEMSEELAAEKGITNGEKVEVFNNRGSITVYAMVTKRFKPFTLGDKTVHQVGMPWHYSYGSNLSHGESANDLTLNAGDANSFIPEYKAFLVDVRKAAN